jgi:hypothetical protein
MKWIRSVKPKMGERKVRSVVNWQEVLKSKGVKRGLGIQMEGSCQLPGMTPKLQGDKPPGTYSIRGWGWAPEPFLTFCSKDKIFPLPGIEP